MFTLRLLGAVDLVDAGGGQVRLVLAQRKQVALLAILALADGEAVRRDRLLGLLWPELPADRARNALSKALHGLRRALGSQAVPAGPGDEVRLDAGHLRCDVFDLVQALDGGDAERALARLGGRPLLEGFHLDDAPAFDEWLEARRSALLRRVLDRAIPLAEAAARRGDTQAAVRWLEVAASVRPFDEGVIRSLIAAHATAGDRSGAMAAYRSFKDRLLAELEVGPSTVTTTLIERVRAGLEDPPAVAAAVDGPRGAATVDRPRGDASVEVEHLRDTSRRWRRRSSILWTLPALLVVAGVWAAGGERNRGESVRRVLVAPVEVDSADSALAGFGLVLADWLTLTLSRDGVADVVPQRFALARLGGRGDDRSSALALAREVEARWVVTGQVRRMGDSLLVFLQIVDPVRETVVQGLEPVRGSIADPGVLLGPLGSRVAGAVAARLDTRVPAAASGPARPPSYGAYLEFIAAIEPWARAGGGLAGTTSGSDFARAAEHFRRAYAIDPEFLSALPWMWEALVLSGAEDEARTVLDEVVARREELGSYELAVVDFLDGFRRGDREDAYLAARRRVALAPYDGDAQWSLGWASVNTNRFGEALRSFDAAEESGGWMGDWANFLQWPARALHLSGDYDGEAALASRFQERFPDAVRFCDHAIRPLIAQGDLGATVAGIDRCVAERVGDPVEVAQFLLGVAMEFRAHGRPDLGTRYADSVVTLVAPRIRSSPDLRGLRRIRFEALLVSGRWEQLVAAVEDDPEPHVVWVNRWGPFGVAAAHLGDTARVDEAVSRLRAAATTSADSAWVHLRVGSILAHLGRLDEALSEVESAVARGLSPAELFHAQRSLEPLMEHPGYRSMVSPRR